ncbi:hypothetical protein Hanom_Chr14g01282481 [Helianthus anomalus]
MMIVAGLVAGGSESENTEMKMNGLQSPPPSKQSMKIQIFEHVTVHRLPQNSQRKSNPIRFRFKT